MNDFRGRCKRPFDAFETVWHLKSPLATLNPLLLFYTRFAVSFSHDRQMTKFPLQTSCYWQREVIFHQLNIFYYNEVFSFHENSKTSHQVSADYVRLRDSDYKLESCKMRLVLLCNLLVSFVLAKVRHRPIGIPEIIGKMSSKVILKTVKFLPQIS